MTWSCLAARCKLVRPLGRQDTAMRPRDGNKGLNCEGLHLACCCHRSLASWYVRPLLYLRIFPEGVHSLPDQVVGDLYMALIASPFQAVVIVLIHTLHTKAVAFQYHAEVKSYLLPVETRLHEGETGNHPPPDPSLTLPPPPKSVWPKADCFEPRCGRPTHTTPVSSE